MNLSLRATVVLTLISVLFFVPNVRSQTPDSIYTVKKGTQIRVRMDSEINSKVFSAGDTFTTRISSPVINRGVQVLPVGTVIEGRITKVKNASFGKNDGSFEVKFENIYLSEDLNLPIEGVLSSLEKTRSSQTTKVLAVATPATAGAIFGAFFQKTKGALIGAASGLVIGTSFILLRKGREARIKANEEFDILLQRDLTLPPQDY